MKALVLAAGLGTRLKPYTHSLPKPLFPVGGKPLLARHLTALAQAGCTAVAVNTHHLHTQIEVFLASRDWGMPVRVSYEPEILGTGGAMKRLAAFWGNAPFLTINADVVCDLDLAAIYRAHLEHDCLATLVMHADPRFNSVAVDRSGRIRMMPPRALRQAPADSRLMAFTGIHVVDPRVLAGIPEGQAYSIIDAYQEMLDQGETLRAHLPARFYWRDIGTPAEYRRTAYEQLVPQAFAAAFGDAFGAASGGPPPSFDAVKRTALAGDGSDRRWYRLEIGSRRLILADHGLREGAPPAEADAYTAIGRHLHRCGVAVPRIYTADPFSGLVFCQDLGDENLMARIGTMTPDDPTGDIEKSYRQVIDALLKLAIEGAAGFDAHWTYQSKAYDRELILEKECRYFLTAFINGYLGFDAAYADLADEFGALADDLLASGVAGLVHRDMQSRNIMWHGGRCYFIDFQGARPGPLQYDIAALLIDPYVHLDPELQERLFDHFCRQATTRLPYDPERLEHGYRLCRVTRNLQILGAFAHLSREKGKPGFEAYLPTAATTLVANLKHPAVIPCPRLTALAEKAAAVVNPKKGGLSWPPLR
jgi:aminoglycoside/choline kinase family phosphotransferase/dTDP-glucose pyrophosphorylase